MFRTQHRTCRPIFLVLATAACWASALPPARAGQPGSEGERPASVTVSSLPTKPPSDWRVPEWLEYVYWNLTGKGQGWFHPGQSRYGWSWLAGRYDADRNGIITRQEFKGPAEWFDRLDRNRDGILTANDLDWSLLTQPEMSALLGGPQPPMGQARDRQALLKRFQEMFSRQLLRKLDTDGDGRVSRDEWLALFSKAAHGKDHLTAEELAEAVAISHPGSASVPGLQREPIGWIRIRGMLKGETGSVLEGPRVGQTAPDFGLRTQDSKQEIHLGKYRGKKPVVLIFGNFT